MRQAFVDFGRGVARNAPRSLLFGDPDVDGRSFRANVSLGSVPSLGLSAVRVDANLLRIHGPAGQERMEFSKQDPRYWGLALIYDVETAALVAIVQTATLSAIRVAATTAVAVEAMLPRQAVVMGLLGSGKQAWANLCGICAVQDVRRVQVYSPSEAHRKALALRAQRELGIDSGAVGSPREALTGADVIACASNANRPLFDGGWLQPGQLVTTIVNSDPFARRSELDATTFARAAQIVVNDREHLTVGNQREILDLLDDGRLDPARVVALGELLLGQRAPARGLLVFKNNVGLAIQFAAAVRAALDRAVQQGVGVDLPDDLFSSDT